MGIKAELSVKSARNKATIEIGAGGSPVKTDLLRHESGPQKFCVMYTASISLYFPAAAPMPMVV